MVTLRTHQGPLTSSCSTYNNDLPKLQLVTGNFVVFSREICVALKDLLFGWWTSVRRSESLRPSRREIRRASWMSLGMMVTRLAWMAHRLVVLEETDQVSLGWASAGHDGRASGNAGRSEVLCDLNGRGRWNGKLADQQLRRLLGTTDFTENDGAGPVTVRLLHSSVAGALLRAAFVASCFLGPCHR